MVIITKAKEEKKNKGNKVRLGHLQIEIIGNKVKWENQKIG